MMDSVKFIDHVKASIKDVRNAKVIVTGASYGGFLSAMMRLNHPETFYGSVAWAAPMRDFGPDESNSDRFNWLDHVSNVYLDESAEAARNIQNALQEISDKIEKNATLPKDIVTELKLCTTPTTQTEYLALLKFLVQAYAAITQYTLNVPLVFPSNALPKLIEATLAAENTTSVLNVLLTIYAHGANCVD